MKIRKEIKIGAIAIVALVLAYAGINFLKGINLFRSDSEYYVRLSNLGGAGIASPVMISGYKVGAVRAVDFGYHEGRGYSALLTLALDPEVRIPRGSRLEVKTSILSGAELIIKADSAGTGYYVAGDTIRAYEGGTDIIAMATEEILPSVASLIPELGKTIARLNTILNDGAIDSTLTHLHQTTVEMQSMVARLNRSMAGMPQVMDNVQRLSASMATVGRNAEAIKLDSVMHNLNAATDNLRAISTQLRSTEGTAGKLLYNTDLYDRLDSLASSADALLKDLKAHPKRYVRLSLF